MSIQRLKYLSEHRLLDLRSNIPANIDRYVQGDFADLAEQNGWAIEHALTVDLAPLQDLDPGSGAEAEVKNSLLVWGALKGLSPALATEERIWARLTHLDCLEFCRGRWLRATDTEGRIAEINKHFFAASQTAIRDDNGVSRLWWNAYIARIVMPDDPAKALRVFLQKADIRSNFIERTRTVSRPALAAGIIRAMQDDPWVTKSESNYRSFMKTVNKFGGGRLFEVMDTANVDRFMRQCVALAKDDAAPDRHPHSPGRHAADQPAQPAGG